MKHKLWVWILAIMVGVYTAFVAMCMWNWFAAPALHVPNISFLQAVGLIWLIGILTSRSDVDDINQKILTTILDSCVPDDKRDVLKENLEELSDNIWIDVLSKAFGQIVANTGTLILGFGLYLLI